MTDPSRQSHSPADPESEAIKELRRVLDDPNSTPAQIKAALAAGAEFAKLDSRQSCMPQVDALIAAGWRFELPREELEPWLWQWRRPSKRAGSKGRLFLSTQQAYNAMMREQADQPEA